MDDLLPQSSQASAPLEYLPEESRALSASIFASFERMLSREQVSELYAMCLDDADRRIQLLEQSSADQDQENFRRVIHAIKGTCGMVGALELAALAAQMEQGPMPTADDHAPYQQFLSASGYLRRILRSKSIPL